MKPPKYRNKVVHMDGMRFDSKKEAQRWFDLRMRAMAGEIADLKAQVRYKLYSHNPDGPPVNIASYYPDFEYREGNKLVCEDVKSPATRKNPTYRLKAKLFKANYPHIDFREV